MRLFQSLWVVSLVSIALGACTSPAPEPTPNLAATVTAVIQEQSAVDSTATPWPTQTPWPTHAPYPRPTATDVPKVPQDRVIRVKDLDTAEAEKFWLDRQPLILVGCNLKLSGDVVDGYRSSYSFTYDGRFAEGNFVTEVYGFKMPESLRLGCYEMLVRYVSERSDCYFFMINGIQPFASSYGCSGWAQVTPTFRLVEADAVREITAEEWSEKYFLP